MPAGPHNLESTITPSCAEFCFVFELVPWQKGLNTREMDLKNTLNLPKTDFPMKAGLPEAEPRWLARWAAMDLYGKIRERARGRERDAAEAQERWGRS